MKSRKRKTEKCLNCGLPLDESYEFCPRCGQENDDRQMSFGRLVRDFFDNYFSLDSRFGRSIKPFFFHPGKLTREFMIGKRMSYANPIRLYLVVSLVHFFFFSIYVNNISDNAKRIYNSDSLADSTDIEENSNTLFENESSEKKDSSENDLNWPMTSAEWRKAYQMTKDGSPNYPLVQIEDSIHNGRRSYTTRYINRQIIKLMKSDRKSITTQIIENIPLLMFILMPVFALILKVFFSSKLYINHVVHALHLHSFAYFMLTIQWILFPIYPNFAEAIDGWIVLIIFVYIVFSFRNTYTISYRRAVFMILLIGLLYMITLGFGLALETFISLLTF